MEGFFFVKDRGFWRAFSSSFLALCFLVVWQNFGILMFFVGGDSMVFRKESQKPRGVQCFFCWW